MKESRETKQNNRRYGRWIGAVLAGLAVLLALIGTANAVVDPFFHYHGPLDGISYSFDSRYDERYINDGISRHFDYNAIITGSSMSENFKTSECDRLFGVKAIKVPFSGARYKEVNDNITRAYESGHDLKLVIRSLDYSLLVKDKDEVYPDGVYPKYLTNDNPFDDVNYLFNLAIFCDNTLKDLIYTKNGGKTTTFDEYANWMKDSTFGADAVFGTYTLGRRASSEKKLTEHDRELIRGNLEQNVISQAEKHPETEFYLFFPPYSICYWDELENDGKIGWHLEAEKYAIEMLLKCPNIRLFSFCSRYDITCDLDNYLDQAHYRSQINDRMLKWMSEGKYELTENNYEDYLSEIRDFYSSYDYGALRARRSN